MEKLAAAHGVVGDRPGVLLRVWSQSFTAEQSRNLAGRARRMLVRLGTAPGDGRRLFLSSCLTVFTKTSSRFPASGAQEYSASLASSKPVVAWRSPRTSTPTGTVAGRRLRSP